MHTKQETRELGRDVAQYAAIVQWVRRYAARSGREVVEVIHGMRRAFQRTIKRPRALAPQGIRCDAIADGEPISHTRTLPPPRVLLDELIGRFMSGGAYNRYIRPVIADMHHEYFQCMAINDERGARWAIVRGHCYLIPSWLRLCLMRVFARVRGNAMERSQTRRSSTLSSQHTMKPSSSRRVPRGQVINHLTERG